ncbi:MAG: efflux RND transporter permease subunit [Sedimentisphaerales bacterium]|nr:efflux RND transporter permease subunit [Sedimentisphaerales bacterium]
MHDHWTVEQRSAIGRLMHFCLANKLVVLLVVLFTIGAGIIVAPFDWDLWGLPRSPVPVDAIPDISENRQIVFTEWMGRSPQDVEDQVTYPLTVALLGIPGVKTIRSYSYFGFSSIYVIFKEGVGFYWSRSRVLEKLNSLPAGTLPPGVEPTLGPDATALGQIFWYTLEGRDPDGNPAGGWDLEELRTIQDWTVRYALLSADGVSEVASVGGFVREYQVDLDPDAMRAYGVNLADAFQAVRSANIDVGAKSIELNRVEYFIRGIGFLKHLEDIETSVVKVVDNVPVLVKDVASVTLGPALRRGVLDKHGAEAVGGVVVARYGVNPLAVIKDVKAKIDQIALGLPEKAHIDLTRATVPEVQACAKQHGFEAFRQDGRLDLDAWLAHLRKTPRRDWPAWATISKVTIVPFYDRTGLIYETLGTLNKALIEEILITVIVVILMVMHLRSSVLISGLLPIAVLMCFVAMRLFGVDANIVALSGIAIAIGTMVDMGIVICENILRHLDRASPEESRLNIIHRAAAEVGSAVLTAVTTTVVSFLPVFSMIGPEGKLFRPLAFTKTFALIASVITALTIIPPAAHLLFCGRVSGGRLRSVLYVILIAAGLWLGWRLGWWAGAVMIALGVWYLVAPHIPDRIRRIGPWLANLTAVVLVGLILAAHWEPLGPQRGAVRNLAFVALLVGAMLGVFALFKHFYAQILGWCLRRKLAFLSIPGLILLIGASIWLGLARVAGPAVRAAEAAGMDPNRIYQTTFWLQGTRAFPGLGKEFMPPLDEGSFLLMPTTMAHASIGEALDILSKQDMALRTIPEIESVVGKIGRAETPLDPAPISMIETIINYKPQYITDKDGHRVKFRFDRTTGQFVRDPNGRLIPDPHGLPFRQWRDHIRTPDDIWRQILQVTSIPGTTSAPRLQPIAARIVMLQSGMRAPMGVKIKGPDLQTIELVGLQIERFLKEVPGVEPASVVADRIVGKPYIEIVPDRAVLARYGISIQAFQDVVEIAIGGMRATTTVEGRERFAVRVRYQRQPERIRASSVVSPWRRRWSTKSSMSTPFLATIPIPMIAPRNETIFNDVPVRYRAPTVPDRARTAPITMAIGSANAWNSINKTVNTSTRASASTTSRLRNDSCCCW